MSEGTTGNDGAPDLAAELRAKHNLSDLSLIGRGGMGQVYRAFDEGLQRWVAVKVIHPDAVSTRDGYQRFAAEMRTLATIRHTAVVNIHYAGSAGGAGAAAYFVMDYVDGGDLEEALAARRASGQRFTVGEVDRVLRPIAEALDHIHGRTPPVVHRDLKPANILLPRDPRSSVGTTAVLTDFGISIAGDDTRVTSTGLVIGTEKYMAPEIFSVASTYGSHMVDYSASTDRYALSLIALEMLTLTAFRDTMSSTAWRGNRTMPPLAESSVAPQDAAAVQRINGVFRRALDNDPSRRPRTAVAFLDLLVGGAGAADRSQPDQTRAVPVGWGPQGQARPVQHVQQGSGRRRGTVRMLSLLVALVLIGVTVVLGVVGYRQFATSQWEAVDARIVAAFPDLLPERQGQSGWRGMTCESSEPRGEEDARVTCRDDGLTMAVVDFGSEQTRSAYVPSQGVQQLEADGCRISVVAASGTGEAMSVFPESAARNNYAMLLTGETVDSASSPLDVVGSIPVC